jgi:hypothetical protein
MKTTFVALALAGALASPAVADRADDDLAAVKKAVASSTVLPRPEARARAAAAAARQAAERTAVEEEEQAPARPHARRGDSPRWFHLRIVGKGDKHARVMINLPLGLVRSIGEDWPLQGCHRCENGRGPTIGEILRSLDAGQSLVDIEDDEATVRVWVD